MVHIIIKILLEEWSVRDVLPVVDHEEVICCIIITDRTELCVLY